MALESFPPLVLVSVRFLLSGSILLAASLWMRAKLPSGRELCLTAVNGILLLGVGNTCLTFAELWLPSGLAALIVTTSAFWLVAMEALMPAGEKLRLPTAAGLLTGAVGAVVLVFPGSRLGGLNRNTILGFLILQGSCLGWSLGSILQKRISREAHPIVSGAIHQLTTGLVLFPAAFFFPGGRVHWHAKGVSALLYLVVFGSIVGYSAYVYVLERLPVALVSIYTYINPIVAVILGRLFYQEHFGRKEAVAMAIIFVGVTIVKKYSHPPTEVELD